MIKENQQLLNRLHILTDGLIIYAMLPLAFYLRFFVLRGGVVSVPLSDYLRLGVALTAVQLFTFAAFGLYQSYRNVGIWLELWRLWLASLLDLALLLGWLFLGHEEHYSRSTLAIFFVLSVSVLSLKRVLLRYFLRLLRKRGFNQKRVLVVGGGVSAQRYLREAKADSDLGYEVIGYIARKTVKGLDLPYLGGYEAMEHVLERLSPDEVVSAIEMADYDYTPQIIHACEQAGVKMSIIPFYADYMPAHPQFDEIRGIPMLNIRRIPLDNFAHAFVKRTTDIIGSTLLLILLSPAMLICAIGVKLSSPGPVIFKQERVGKDKKRFYMYKFRSMRLNDAQDSAWSMQTDSRRTAFGAFIRKCSLDELPQFWNVLKGDMSLVGPRPEIPHYVDQFKDEIPLYMVRHQVRPGITGWAQINGLRGNTPIKERIEHDVYYIENWTPWLDVKILLITLFGGKFLNDEKLA